MGDSFRGSQCDQSSAFFELVQTIEMLISKGLSFLKSIFAIGSPEHKASHSFVVKWHLSA